MRILVIEDEKNLREQLVTRLQQQGYAVDAASDGEDGLFMATEHPFDAAVIDLGLTETVWHRRHKAAPRKRFRVANLDSDRTLTLAGKS